MLKHDTLLWLLGLLGFGYFGVTILGSITAEHFLQKISCDTLFPLGYLCTGLSLLFLSRTQSAAAFFFLYLLLYLFLGIGDTALNVSLHHNAPPAFRSTLLSTQSLLFQFGGLIGSFLCSRFVNQLQISGLWTTGGIVFITCILFISFLLKQKIKNNKENHQIP